MANTQPLPRSLPEAQGISSKAVARFIRAAEKNIQSLHSFMLLRHGSVVAEGWWRPYRAEAPHMLFSLSKSFTSTAVGLAVAEGRLSVDDSVLKFFPDDAPKKISPRLQAMKVRHLLSMSTGHHQDTTERAMRSRNPFKAFLSIPVRHDPGAYFVYNSGASYMLAAIVQKLTGQTLIEYLTPRLFTPLGIEGAWWESHPNGVNFGGWGLNIKTEDIARFGQLYLQKGRWNGKQILPQSWVEEATSKQVSNGDDPNSDWAQGYGYQFWRCRHNSYRGDGAFGQYCIVMPDQDAVAAITAGLPDMQAVLNLVWDILLPAMEASSLPPDQPAAKKLQRTLHSLELKPPEGAAASPLADSLKGKTFHFAPNYEKLKTLSFDFSDASATITYRLAGSGPWSGEHRLVCGHGSWQDGVAALGALGPRGVAPLPPRRVAASGAWTADDTYTIFLCMYETPFIATITCRFEGEKVYYRFKVNVSFGPTEMPELVGAAE